MIIVPAIIYMAKECAKSLIAEDPYQYEHLSDEQLINVAFRQWVQKFKSEAMVNEITKRLNDPNLNEKSRELLSEVLEALLEQSKGVFK